MTEQPRPAASLDEMRALLAALPEAAARAEPARDRALAVLDRLAGARGRGGPRLDHPRVALFAAAHGVAVHRPPAAGPDLGGRIDAILERRDPLLAAAEAIDADLRLYEMAWPRPCGDITREPAQSDAAAATAMAYGMMAVDEAIDILCLATLGDEGAVAAGAIGLALFGGTADDWAPRGAATLVEAAVERHGGAGRDAFELLRRLGGEDIAAMAGAILAASFARVPVVLDGAAAVAAAAILERAAPGAVRHCLTTGRSCLGDALGLLGIPGAVAGDTGLSAIGVLRDALERAAV